MTVSDKKIGTPVTGIPSQIAYYTADVKSAQDYYPFGMEMPGSQFNANYAYSFNGKRDDKDAEYGWQDYGMREYDKLRGQFISVDPIAGKYPWNSTYAFSENDVIRNVDLDGLEKIIYLIDKFDSRISVTKMMLLKAGPLGDGVAVRYNNNNKTIHNFYGGEIGTAKNFAKSYEGKGIPNHPFERYNDQYGQATIGYGHLMNENDKKKYPITAYPNSPLKGSKISEPDADLQFTEDYNSKVSLTIRSLKPLQFEGGKLEAFTDFSFNIKNAESRIRSFDPKQGGTFFLEYMRGGPGLEKRRIGEMLMYEEGTHILLEYQNNSKINKELNRTIRENTPFSGGGNESKNLHDIPEV